MQHLFLCVRKPSFLLLNLALAGGATLLLPAPAAAQAPPAPAAGTGSLTGVVLDSVARQPVPYATVALLPPAPNNTPLTGVAADDQGRFALTKLVPGPARLRVSYVGYGTQTQAVTITTGATEVGAFRLPTAGTALAEAVVIGTKPVVEMRPDRLIYNADQDVTNAGGTAADVLRKAPLLAVDGDGNVKLRGSGNFKVLINNKPAPTLASNLAEALKSLPADQIASVEVITTPGARYDGEGTAGIINIVLKKGVDRGLNGRVSASAGLRDSNLNSSLNGKKGKLGLTSAFNMGRWYGLGEDDRERTTRSEQGTAVLRQQGAGTYTGQWYYTTLGLDYELSERQNLSVAGSLNGWAGRDGGILRSRAQAPSAIQEERYSRRMENPFNGRNSELTGTYTRTFAQARREWTVLGQYARQDRTFGIVFDQFNDVDEPLATGQASYRERSHNHKPGDEWTAQTDFTQPLGAKQTLETGLKAIWRHANSAAEVEGYTLGQTDDFVPLPARATDFRYDQDVQAAYATYAFTASKQLTLHLGSRLERTALVADFRTTDTGFGRSYLSLLPTGNAQYAFSEAHSLRLAYGRRITRPSIRFLNPFVDRSNPQNIFYGNPNLDPELTDSYELSFNSHGKAGSLNVSLSARRTGNAIEAVRLPTAEAGVLAETFANVAANTFYHLHVYGSAKPRPQWDISGGPDVKYLVFRSTALGLERRGFAAGLSLNTSYKVTKDFTLQGNFQSSLPSPELQGRGAANLYYALGLKQKLLHDQADLTLNAASFLQPLLGVSQHPHHALVRGALCVPRLPAEFSGELRLPVRPAATAAAQRAQENQQRRRERRQWRPEGRVGPRAGRSSPLPRRRLTWNPQIYFLKLFRNSSTPSA